MAKIVKKNIIKQVEELFEDYDKNPNWTRRDIFLATTLKKYTKEQYDDIAIIIGDYMANNDNRNFDHNSMAMDIVASLVFLSGDLDGVDILLEDIPAHPKSNLRALLSMSVETCRAGMTKVDDFFESFSGVGE